MTFYIMHMDMFAGLDIADGHADVLTIFDHRLPFGDVAGGHLVINGDILARGQAFSSPPQA